MPIMTFNSREPYLSDLDIDHGRLGAHADALLQHPAHFDSTHPLHVRVVGEVQATFDAIFGDKPVEGGQPFDVMRFQTGDAQPTDKSVESGQQETVATPTNTGMHFAFNT